MKTLEENFNIQQALEVEMYKRFGSGESPEAWRRLVDIVKRYENSEASDRAEAFEVIRSIVETGYDESLLVRDIVSIHETQRKTVEAIFKIRRIYKSLAEEALREEFVSSLLDVMQRHIYDRNQLQAISREFRILAGD